MSGLIDSADKSEAKLDAALAALEHYQANLQIVGKSMDESELLLIAAQDKIVELQARILLRGPIENAEKAIQDAGGDPEQIGKDGASFVRALMAEKKLRASESRLKEFEKWTTELCDALEYAEDYCVHEGRLDEDEKMTLGFEEWQAKAAGRTITS